MTSSMLESPLRIEDYFDGTTRAVGLFVDRFGRIRRHYEGLLKGRRDGDTLILDETFTYDDGTAEDRTWTIHPTPDGHYTCTANGVVGTGHARANGPVVTWSYRLQIPVGTGLWTVRADDRMILRRDGVMLNRAALYRWGFRIGTAWTTFTRASSG